MEATKEKTPALRLDRNFDMPSIPLVLTKIIQLLDDDATTARELEELIRHDPSLSARILKLANSAFYSFRNEVKTLSHAIPLIGINLVKSLAIGVNIFDSFTRGMKSEAAQINRLWAHSFGVGALSQQIWVRRSSRKEGEFAFLCGLLHDLGKVVFFKKDGKHYGEIFALEKTAEHPDLCAMENERYGTDHAAIGEMIVRHWGLPPELAVVLRHHHDPLSVDAPLVWVVTVADTLARAGGIGYDGDARTPEHLEAVMQCLNMYPDEYRMMQDFAVGTRPSVEEFFGSSPSGSESTTP